MRPTNWRIGEPFTRRYVKWWLFCKPPSLPPPPQRREPSMTINRPSARSLSLSLSFSSHLFSTAETHCDSCSGRSTQTAVLRPGITSHPCLTPGYISFPLPLPLPLSLLPPLFLSLSIAQPPPHRLFVTSLKWGLLKLVCPRVWLTLPQPISSSLRLLFVSFCTGVEPHIGSLYPRAGQAVRGRAVSLSGTVAGSAVTLSPSLSAGLTAPQPGAAGHCQRQAL